VEAELKRGSDEVGERSDCGDNDESAALKRKVVEKGDEVNLDDGDS